MKTLPKLEGSTVEANKETGNSIRIVTIVPQREEVEVLNVDTLKDQREIYTNQIAETQAESTARVLYLTEEIAKIDAILVAAKSVNVEPFVEVVEP